MSEVFYVYEHIRNDTNEIFYVGKGKKGSGRSNYKYDRNIYWQRIVNKTAFTTRKIATGLSEELSFKKEKERIKELRKLGVKLSNMTDGGEGLSGYIPTTATLAKISKAKSNPSDETRGKISKAKSGENNPMYNKKHSEETLVKMRAYKRAKGEATKETRAKMRASALVRPPIPPIPKVTCPHCGKEGKNNGMKKHHFDYCPINPCALPIPEYVIRAKQRQSAAKTGKKNPFYNKKHSEETLAKMRATALAKPLKPKLTCPHCYKVGGHSAMKRWHFDNCRNAT